MKKHSPSKSTYPGASLRRRQLVMLMGLTLGTGVAWPYQLSGRRHSGLSLHEADFYSPHDLAG